jgi:hypothetical protein
MRWMLNDSQAILSSYKTIVESLVAHGSIVHVTGGQPDATASLVSCTQVTRTVLDQDADDDQHKDPVFPQTR